MWCRIFSVIYFNPFFVPLSFFFAVFRFFFFFISFFSLFRSSKCVRNVYSLIETRGKKWNFSQRTVCVRDVMMLLFECLVIQRFDFDNKTRLIVLWCDAMQSVLTSTSVYEKICDLVGRRHDSLSATLSSLNPCKCFQSIWNYTKCNSEPLARCQCVGRAKKESSRKYQQNTFQCYTFCAVVIMVANVCARWKLMTQNEIKY